MKIKKKILVLWYSIGNNFGDYYIYKTIRENLQHWGYEVTDMDVGTPYKILVKAADACDFLWFAGGGIIERNAPDIIRYFIRFHIKAKKIKYGITGLSIGEFDYSEYKRNLKYWIEHSCFFYTRDLYSAQMLNRISAKERVMASADVVFAYMDGKQGINDKHYVGVSLRRLPYIDLTGDFEWEHWNHAIEKIKDREVIGIPDQDDCTQKVSFDFYGEYNPDNVMKAISECEFIISMRFHAIVLAACMGKASIPICYCPKVRRLASQLGLEDLCLDVHEYEALPRMVAKLQQYKEIYESSIQKNVNICQNQVKEMLESIENILKREIL